MHAKSLLYTVNQGTQLRSKSWSRDAFRGSYGFVLFLDKKQQNNKIEKKLKVKLPYDFQDVEPGILDLW